VFLAKLRWYHDLSNEENSWEGGLDRYGKCVGGRKKRVQMTWMKPKNNFKKKKFHNYKSMFLTNNCTK
jgi:hypothetical protein